VEAAAPAPRLRADAERNRRRVLAAAREVLAERGVDAGLDEVARRAGVGIGTVYRRFPDRDALVGAVLEELTDELVAVLDGCSGGEPDAASCLRVTCRRYAEHVAANTALFDVVKANPEAVPGFDGMRRRLLAAFRRPLVAAQEAGAVREDLHPRDLVLLLSAVARIRPPGRGGATLWRRELEVVLDGLAPREASKLPRLP
jgi:AcrR family transcriptional regulator